MGMFDYVDAVINPCPVCGKKHKMTAQTKDGAKCLRHYKEGDLINKQLKYIRFIDDCKGTYFEGHLKLIRGRLTNKVSNVAVFKDGVNQSLYPRPEWAESQTIRASGLVEDICEHEVGHPNVDWLKLHDKPEYAFGVHGCCGCCSKEIEKHIDKMREENEKIGI